MILDFKAIPETEIKNFYEGEKAIFTHMFNDGNNRIMLAKLAPGASVGLHTHQGSSEVIFILEGTGKAIYDGQEEELKPGTCHYCPMDHQHTLINKGKKDLVFYGVVPQHRAL